MPYKVLSEFFHDGEGWEVRKYTPQKRTVIVGGREYFLQFPWLVFMKLISKRNAYLSLAFAKEDDFRVYAPLLPNCGLYTNRNIWTVCLGSGYTEIEYGHYLQRSEIKFDAFVARFWSTRFDSYDGWDLAKDASYDIFGYSRLHAWGRMNLSEILDRLHLPYGSISLDDFILNQMNIINERVVQR
jgi:hypothetical protein